MADEKIETKEETKEEPKEETKEEPKEEVKTVEKPAEETPKENEAEKELETAKETASEEAKVELEKAGEKADVAELKKLSIKEIYHIKDLAIKLQDKSKSKGIVESKKEDVTEAFPEGTSSDLKRDNFGGYFREMDYNYWNSHVFNVGAKESTNKTKYKF